MKKINTIICFLVLAQLAKAQTPSFEKSMQDFFSDRFGMFIHWGPVSLRGTEIGWSRDKEVSKEDYDSLYKEFNPVLFNADTWVKTAKDAGMKYLTITARHHDGFCIWPTKFTAYNISNTPYKKDILGALNKACKKQGIKFCLYYSILDWYHPDYPIHSAHNSKVDPKSDLNKYRAFLKNQLKELITMYDPFMLWFDGAWESPWTDEMGKELYTYLKTLKPSLIVNNRLGKEIAAVSNKKIDVNKMVGDYDTPEQVVGRLNMETPWESCFTICNQWSWKPNDKLKSLEECMSILLRTAGGNGNLLLNVGPMPDGRIEARQINRLKEMGHWLKKYAESIYNTNGGPYLPNNVYSATRKSNTIYVHLFDETKNELVLPALQDVKILNMSWMYGSPADWKETDGQYQITIPSKLPDSLCNVLVIQINKPALDIPVQKSDIN